MRTVKITEDALQIQVCVFLPFPPTTNNLFAGKERRHKSEAYKAWLWEAEYQFRQQQVPMKHYARPVKLQIALGRPDRRKREPSNYIKAPEDFLVRMGMIMDDSQVEDVRAYWCPETVGARLLIEPI